MTTICKACAEFFQLEGGTCGGDVWYNHLCKAHPLPIAVDPYDGKLKPTARNDLGQSIFVERRFDYCRNHNDGNCAEFRAA